ncbi:hypothetical protein BpOF4_04960 [Alkalihalophilus pseudofirmus OF4]|uniref:Uncharacterized protein n=1 Tax=Alkalihalophilus pseudofirmus (strain ATCC BAA-2126 / JCM 17055 / OF4) TaxID=398511 RepID=D3FZ23_ALKPO|nr:hypothetical protein BpOF4_04960 [Alkalihalophilus pseudofirmus OF4]
MQFNSIDAINMAIRTISNCIDAIKSGIGAINNEKQSNNKSETAVYSLLTSRNSVNIIEAIRTTIKKTKSMGE